MIELVEGQRAGYSSRMLQLTEFGEVSLKTGLSPKSAISLARFLKGYTEITETGKDKKARNQYDIKWEPIIASIWGRHSTIQELQHYQIGIRGFPIKNESILLTTMAWISGTPIELIAFILYKGKEK